MKVSWLVIWLKEGALGAVVLEGTLGAQNPPHGMTR